MDLAIIFLERTVPERVIVEKTILKIVMKLDGSIVAIGRQTSITGDSIFLTSVYRLKCGRYMAGRMGTNGYNADTARKLMRAWSLLFPEPISGA
jgi:hypothetical protein